MLIRLVTACFVLVAVAACGNTMRGVQEDASANFGTAPSAEANVANPSIEEVWVGVVAVKQSVAADNVVNRTNPGADRFFGLYDSLKNREVEGVSGEVLTIFFRENGKPVPGSTQYTKVRNGVGKISAPRHLVTRHTALCVRVPEHWGYIARQEVYPEGTRLVMCEDGSFGSFVASGGGRTREEAWGVYVIKPGSQKQRVS